MKRLLHSVFPYNDFLYIAQLEEYNTRRYFKHLTTFFFRRSIQKRDHLVITTRVKLTRLISIGITLFSASIFLGLSLWFVSPWLLLLQLFSILCIPIWVGKANAIVGLITYFPKRKVRERARALIAGYPEVKVIGITGSFGKTTTKNFLAQLLSSKYRVQMTPGNVNSPMGIADWVLDKFEESTDILIVEMGAFSVGEIAASAKIVPPDYAVITALGDQHMERFGNFGSMVKAKFEIFEGSKPGAKLYISEEAYKKAYDFSQATQNLLTSYDVELVNTLDEFVTFGGKQLSCAFMSKSNKQNFELALAVVEELNIPYEFVSQALEELTLPERRQVSSQLSGFTVIDDSYNISPTTARAGVEQALIEAERMGRNLVLISAGIPEQGNQSGAINSEYGRFLKDKIDHLVLLRSKLSKAVGRGMLLEKYDMSKLDRADTMAEAWKIIEGKFKPEEVLVLMQPELTDLYY